MLKNELTDTCVQRDKHLCSSRQTQVFEPTDASVCQTGEYRGRWRDEELAFIYFDYCRCYQESNQDAVYTMNGEAVRILASQRKGKL